MEIEKNDAQQQKEDSEVKDDEQQNSPQPEDKSEIGLKKIIAPQMYIKKNDHSRLTVIGIPDKQIRNVLAGLAVVGLVTIATAAVVVATGGAAAIIAGAAIGGTISVGMTALFDKINNRVSSVSEYIFNGFTGAVTGAISGRIAASALKAGAKLLAEAGSGFVLGGIEDATRQVVIEGKEKVDLGQSVMNGIKNAGLALAVPVVIKGISKGTKAVLNKINTPGVNTVVGEVGEDVAEKTVKETGEEVVEESVEKGTKSLGNNADEVISDGLMSKAKEIKHPVLDNTRSGSGLKNDGREHGFNDIIDNYAQYAEEFNIIGGDGIERKLYQIEGGQKSYTYKTIRDNEQKFDVIERTTKDYDGIFEWIVDPNRGVTHRRFIPCGEITGTPNQIQKTKGI